MTTAYTPLLGFALPTEGELDGAWGDVVNDNITSLLDSAIAGYATASVTSANWTLTTTGVGLPNQARMAILIPTGTPGVSRNIVAPSSSKTYIVINQSNAAVVLKGAATTGLTILTGTYVLAAWNGTDFVQIGKSGTVTTTSVASANGFAGTVATADTTPAITLSTSITGVLKGNGTALSAATSGTDYAPGTSALTTGIVKSTTSTGALTIATSGTDYAPGTSALATGIVKSATSTGALTIATSGTDYAPGTSALTTGIVKSTTSTGALTIATAGTDYVTPTGTETLTNKTITSRVVASTADTTPVAINSGTTDMATLIYTTAATTVTFSAPSGSPVNGQKLIIRIRTTNVQTLAWNAVFAGGTSTSLPTASSGSSKFDYFGFIYNDTVSKWQLIGTAFGY